MKNLLHFIVRFHFTILFVVIEIFCLLLVVNYNNYQKTEFLNSSNALSGNIYNKISSITDYLNLARTNEELNRENVRLSNLLAESLKTSIDSSFYITTRSINNVTFIVQPKSSITL